MAVEFIDNSMKVKSAIAGVMTGFLYEAAGELEAQVKRNTRVDTGQTKGAWDHVVDEENMEAVIGNPLENAIWEEFGTGEYALEGNGRKGGWKYQDENGEWHYTEGKEPNRALQSAFHSLKPAIIKKAEEAMKGLG